MLNQLMRGWINYFGIGSMKGFLKEYGPWMRHKVRVVIHGVQHDYTRKQGLVWEHVFLPDCAPKEWQDRAVLWNAVEETEKTKDSRLAREFVVALPVELGKRAWVKKKEKDWER